MFTDERAAAIFLRQAVASVKNEAEVAPRRSLARNGNDRPLHQIRALRLDTRIEVPVSIGAETDPRIGVQEGPLGL